MITARRISQVLFLLLFLFFFLQARYPYETFIPSDLFLRSSPLVGLATMIAARAFIATAILSLIVLLLTIPLGRFFCGWVCPLGTVIDASDKLIKRKKAKLAELDNKKFRSWKFAILIAVLVGSIFSMQFVWFFDPIALLTRTMTTVIFPSFVFVVKGLFDFAFTLGFLEDQLYSAYNFAQNSVLPVSQPRFYQSLVIFLIFGGILALGLVSKRFWCRNLCPLGALLGIFSKYRIVKRYVSEECNQCAVCRRECRMNAIEDDYTINNTVECIECAECVAVCKPHAVSYKFGFNKGKNEIDLSRRRFLQASVAGVASIALVKTAAANRNNKGYAIRPPGAVPEDEFLDRCIRCQECVRICSTTGACLQPSMLQSGWEGIWSPVAVPRLGYCEFNCNLCGQVCPTGAIRNIDLERKKKLRMGLAYFDKTRCIPWQRQEDCLVCEEHCPTPDKAIKFDIHEARGPDGAMRMVKFPYVIKDLCIGCGICETKCPVIGHPGIYVTADNEERIIV
ncbi:hypothetical protein A2V82_04440 [candidate division KSB1 bacterium RBG_16_48_16]|nr:MAG: hypothetical protein A2V82_04440 [candidate division KSB1 bacterium RBG_16_48_16]